MTENHHTRRLAAAGVFAKFSRRHEGATTTSGIQID
jgi:hypothetical protein